MKATKKLEAMPSDYDVTVRSGVSIIQLNLRRWTSHGKEWAAKITGLSDKYGFERDFCKIVERNWSYSGKTGHTIVELDGPGYYHISDPRIGRYGRDCQYYAKLTEDQELVCVAKSEVEQAFATPSDL